MINFRNCFLAFTLLFFGNKVVAQACLGLSGFYVQEKNTIPIGFSAFDVSMHPLDNDQFRLNTGMRFIGAFDGVRGGYFAFGYFGEGIFFPKRKLQLGLSTALLAGGGATAPDKDGWMIQSNAFFNYQTKSGIGFRAGINHTYVSSGFIQGFSPTVGITWNLNLPKEETDSGKTTKMIWNSNYTEAGRAYFGKQALDFVGAGASYEVGHYFSGDLALHAIVNTHGGYMQLLTSFGPKANLQRFHFSPAVVLGLGGGGAIQTKGGTLYGLQFAATYTGKRLFSAIKYQMVNAVSEKFHYQGVFVSLGKTLNAHSKIPWYATIKAYPTKAGFGNLGARFVAYENKHLAFMGSTYWAFTNDRGAYAEGLFEVSYRPVYKVPVYVIFSAGAGGGAAINKKTSAQIMALGIGVTSPYRKLPLSLEVACWRGGNIPEWSLTMAYRFDRK